MKNSKINKGRCCVIDNEVISQVISENVALDVLPELLKIDKYLSLKIKGPEKIVV